MLADSTPICTVQLPSRYQPSSLSTRSFRHLQPIQDHLMSNSWAVNPKDHIDIGPQRTDVDRRDENGEIFPLPDDELATSATDVVGVDR
jgi:hypothetical protein